MTEKTANSTDLPPIKADDAPVMQKPSPQEAGGKTGRRVWGVMWFLLLVVLFMGAAAYWGFAQWQQQQQALAALQSRVADLDQNLSAQLTQRASTSELSHLADATQSTQQALQLAVADLQATLGEHKQRLEGFQQTLGQDANQWRLSEIERLLTAAQLRVGALDDPIGARHMLREVERLASALGGETQDLRTAVQQLAGALDRGVPLDRDGVALKMFNLAQMMPNLPLKMSEVQSVAAAADPVAPQNGWWNQSKVWLSSLVTIKNTAQPIAIKPSAARSAPLTEATQTLLKAREALLARHVDEAARLSAQALSQAEKATTLDSASPQVQHALAALRDIAGALEQGYRPQSLDFAPAFVALRSLREPPTLTPPSATHPVSDLLMDAPVDAPLESQQTKEP